VLYLALHGLEIPLNPGHSNRERIDQVKVLGMLGQVFDEMQHLIQFFRSTSAY
jgi:hypothetical protein